MSRPPSPAILIILPLICKFVDLLTQDLSRTPFSRCCTFIYLLSDPPPSSS
jgi:hypothetical protein